MKSLFKKIVLGIALPLLALGAPHAWAQSASFTGSYLQNFDTALGASGTALPIGFTALAIPGGNGTYTAAIPMNAAAIAGATNVSQALILWNATTKVASSGTQCFNIGGWDSASDRSLGTDPTGTGGQLIQLSMTNNTGGTLFGVTFNYDCKCLTNGSVGTEQSELPGYCFFYSTAGTNLASWTEVGAAGNVPGATNISGVPIADGLCLPNFTQNTTMSSGSVNITFGTPLTNNGVMYFRWADDNNVANSPDQMISIDNISIATFTPPGPTVTITSPASGSTFGAGSISLQASAPDLTGSVTNVSYFSGSTLLGQATAAPYNFTWLNVGAGSYSLTARAIDNGGLMATSSVVSVTVTNPLVTSFTGTYTQNFDLALTNSTTTVPPGFAALNLPGSHFTYTNAPGLFLDSNAIATATIGSGAGSLIVWNVGSAVTDASSQLFNVGCWDTLNDRALGTDPTGTAGTVIQLAMTNNTGSPLAGVVFSYTEKCMTNGATSNGAFTDDGTERLELPGYEFFYSITGDTQPTNWFAAPVLSATNWIQDTVSNAGPVTLIFPRPLPNGGIMYFRWADDNCVASSPDQMYAIDNVAISTFNPVGPQVSFTSPLNNQNFIPGTGFTASLNVTDNGNTVTNVTLYINNSPVFNFTSAPYTVNIPGSDVAPGSYTFTAVAMDTAGLSATSAVVNVTVAFVPPTVSITNPPIGSSFPAPATISLGATAASTDASITNVAIYQGTTLLGNVTTPPYNFLWANVSAGNYALTAVAADSQGLTATSSVVSISVTNGFGLPVVTLTSPANNSTFAPGANISIAANAGEAGGTITNVEFYTNGIALGGSTTAPYGITWANVSLGTYTVTAVAADAGGITATSAVANVFVVTTPVPPTVNLLTPTNTQALDVANGLSLSATASPGSRAVTNVAFYLNTFLVANVATAPYSFILTNAPTGDYTLRAIVTDQSGLSSTSAVVNVVASNSIALATLKQIKTFFIIPLENHDFVQANPEGSPQQLLGNPACPYFNSLITPGNSNAVQTAYATHYFSCAINGEHPSEPNYLWAEAGTDFGIRTDNDPSGSSHNIFTNVPHLSGQLTAAGVSWRSYQEDLEYSSSEEVSVSGSGKPVNPYNGTTQYSYAVKHNPMAFFNDTQNKNCFPLTNFWADLASNNVARYNWLTPNQFNEMHSALSGGYTNSTGVAFTGDQAAIASGDNALSIIVPRIMSSPAYKDHGVIIIWTDETESTDDTNTTLPYVIISSLTKGNAYSSTLAYSHSSDLKTMDEIFNLAYQTNAIPGYLDSQNTGTNYVDGRSAIINDLSDFFVTAHVPPVANPVTYTRAANVTLLISITNLLSNVSSVYGNPITLVGVGTDGLNLLTTNGATLANNGAYILYTNGVTPNVNDSFLYTVSDGQGGTNVGTVSIVINNNLIGQTNPKLATTTTNITATFFGVPGFRYTMDRSTNLTVGEGWMPISTNVAPADGVIQVLDNFQDLGIPIPPLPGSAFYRLQYNP